jgi:hypothetical protein
MRVISLLMACGLILLVVSPLHAAPDAVVAEPKTVAPGQTVTLRWYFTGDKVVVSGGRFGKGVVVTGRTSLTDRPRKTTRYTYDVWYHGQAPGRNPGQTVIKPLHARYTVVVEVQKPVPSPLAFYRNAYGWRIGYLKGWKCDSVPLSDPQNNGLFYFQQEDDSVERLAVSVLPAGDMDCVALMNRVQADLPSHYDRVKVEEQTQITHAAVPAVWMTFTGQDQTHPGIQTQSLVLALVLHGRAYVISARTAASRFLTRQAVLEKMVKSFAFVGDTARKPN